MKIFRLTKKDQKIIHDDLYKYHSDTFLQLMYDENDPYHHHRVSIRLAYLNNFYFKVINET